MCSCGSMYFRYPSVEEGSPYDVVCRKCNAEAPENVSESQIVSWW